MILKNSKEWRSISLSGFRSKFRIMHDLQKSKAEVQSNETIFHLGVSKLELIIILLCRIDQAVLCDRSTCLFKYHRHRGF